MTTNRAAISETDIVLSEQLLDKGIPIAFLGGKYEVKEGFNAVLIEGGTFKEILKPGFYHLNKYKMFRDLKSILVDCRIKQLEVRTNREFQIRYPVPVHVELNLSMEYQVVQPRRVALEIANPLKTLFDRVLIAVRGAITQATIEDVRSQGERIAEITRQRLAAMQVSKTLGIEVINVFATTLKALDASGDALGQQQYERYQTVQDWQLESMIASNSRITPEWLALNRPELYAQMLAGNTAVMKELIDKGLMDPAGFLNQPVNMQMNSFNPMFPQMIDRTNDMIAPQSSAPGFSGGMEDPQKMLNSSTNSVNQSPTRMNEEIEMLKNNLAGVNIDTRPGTNQNGIPDGSFQLRITIPRPSGGGIVCYIYCSAKYPQIAPSFSLEVDGEDVYFEPTMLKFWKPQQYLIELIREAIRYVG